MDKFTYESQGTETMLVYHLDSEEHVDNFAKGMLQSNEMTGILRPSFMRRDMDQFLKYPVTSRIPLKDFLSKEMDRETVMKLCMSITDAVKEMEEYMLTPDKLMLHPDYIFVDIAKKEAGLIYLPVDEFSQDIDIKEFILNMLSHMRFQMDKDVSYVAKLIHFLNQSKPWGFDELKRYIENLLTEKTAVLPEPARAEKISIPVNQVKPVSNGNPVNSAKPVNLVKPADAVEQNVNHNFVPPVKSVDKKKETEKKGGWLGRKEKKEKTSDMPPVPTMPGMAVPGMELPKAEPVLNKPESSEPVQNQEPADSKKKGLFHFGKKKKDVKIPAGPPLPVTPNVSAPVNTPPIQKSPAVPVVKQATPLPPNQNQEVVSVYAENGSSDDDNRTVIMGGGSGYENSTVILGGMNPGEKKGQIHHAARLTRRRTGQSMTINKEVFRIGREDSFVDFYIGDNAAIGACHAEIFEKEGCYYIMDRNSLNHTFVNGIMVQPMQSVQLSGKGVITLADEDFDYIIS